MSQSHHFKHIAEGTKHAIDNMKPLKEKKNPIIAGICGLILGPLGVSLYFQSLKDFFLCAGVLLALLVLIPGLGLIPGYLFAPIYGIYRAIKSNENL